MKKITSLFLMFSIPFCMFAQHAETQKEDYLVQKISKEEANELIKTAALSLLQTQFATSLKKVIELAKNDPEAFSNPPATCFAPDTDSAFVEAFYERRSAVQNSLGISQNSSFTLTSRWFSTATDGGGLGQGDVTTLTWSYVPDGTTIGNSGCQLPDAGTFSSDFIAFFNGIYGAPTVPGDFTTAPWHAIFISMFNSWSDATGLIFVYEPNDDGATNCLVSNPGSLGTRGDMRISGHLIDGNSGVLACNYFPTSSGDMIIDTGDNFFVNNPTIGTTNVLTHEVGHGVGLRHVCPANQTKLMEPFITTAFNGPQEDDILGTNRHYGDPDEVNNSVAVPTFLGANPLPTSYSKQQRSIDDNTDLDYFSFTINQQALLSGSLTPTGTTYLNGTQNPNGSCSPGSPFNASVISDLMFDVLDTDGVTILASGNVNGLGIAENVSNIILSIGTYYIRVLQQGAAVDNVQMYDLALNLVNTDAPPTALCTNFTTQLDAAGNVSIVAADVDGGSSDPEGAVTLSVSPSSFTCANIGANTVTLTVTDTSGNTDSCTATVTIEDVTLPTITCPADQNEDFDANCEFALPDYTGLATVADTCDAAPSVTQLPAPGTIITTTATITLTVTDASGNSDLCTFDVIPEDNTAPAITCLADQNEDFDANCEFILPDYTGLAIVLDNCDPNPLVTQSPIAGTVITVTTQITIFAEDALGNINSCVFDVIPLDTTAPAITCPADENVAFDANCEFVLPDYTGLATVSDACDPAPSVIQSPAPGTAITTTTVVTLTATDASLNSDFCTFNIIPADTTPPTAVCQAFTGQLDAAGMVVITAGDVDGGSTDNCAIASLSVSPNTFTCADVGTQTVTLTVTDAAGNTSTCEATVTVEDTIPPTAVCQDITVSLGDENTVTILPGDLDGGNSDNCSVASVTASQTTFTCDDIGMNTVTVTVTDINGNTSTCTAIVTIVDVAPPITVCQAFTALLDAMGTVTILPTDVDGGSTDNCGIDTITVSQVTFDCDDVGENTVTLTVTDFSGNSATCTAIVTVEDTVAPDALCQDITIQLDASGMATIIADDVNGGSSDACGIQEISVDTTTFDCSNVGTNNVTLSVTDVHGNIGTCIAVVTVIELNAVPIAVCRNITVPLEQDGTAVITPSDIDAGSSGGGCVNGLTLDIDTFDCGDIGTPVQVTLSVMNANGAIDSCTAFVNVVDTLDPVLTCPEDEVILAEQAPYTLPDYVALGEVFAEDNCLNITSIVQTPPTGTVLASGAYNISFVAEDPSGNETSCSFRLTIEAVLGAPTQASLTSISLFPNPASDYINIANPNNIELQMVKLYDVTGRLIKTFQMDNTTDQRMDVSEIASATYLLLITAENGQLTKQIVKE
jgi:hypothetical protein